MEDFFLTNSKIRELVNEPKQINQSVYSLMKSMKPKRDGSPQILRNSFKFPRQNGKGEWRLYVRLNLKYPMDFSCGLELIPENREQGFRLRRYNGKSHFHTNQLERDTFQDFHIHIATEKYQHSRYKDDHYAERTDRYGEFKEALECLFKDCKIEGKIEAQQEMF